jgi:N-acetyl-anhydromuramyl-L-alanine amidase AmpD
MQRSIGIELENNNTGHDPYPAAQLNSLLDLSRYLVGKYRIRLIWLCGI